MCQSCVMLIELSTGLINCKASYVTSPASSVFPDKIKSTEY